MNRTRLAAGVRLALLAGSCAAGIAAVWRAENPALDPPPTDPTRWSDWIAAREPIDVVASVSRVVATAALGYCVALSSLLLLAFVFRSNRLRHLAARLSPGPLAALSALAIAGTNPAVASASQAADQPDPPVMRVIEDPATEHGADEGAEPDDSDVPTVTSMAPRTTAPAAPERSGPDADGTTTGDGAATGEMADGSSGAGPTALDYTVERGDSFWEIARRRVRLATGHDPSDAEIRSYWVALVASNEDRLSDPDDPNLLFPGQTLRLPG